MLNYKHVFTSRHGISGGFIFFFLKKQTFSIRLRRVSTQHFLTTIRNTQTIPYSPRYYQCIRTISRVLYDVLPYQCTRVQRYTDRVVKITIRGGEKNACELLGVGFLCVCVWGQRWGDEGNSDVIASGPAICHRATTRSCRRLIFFFPLVRLAHKNDINITVDPGR